MEFIARTLTPAGGHAGDTGTTLPSEQAIVTDPRKPSDSDGRLQLIAHPHTSARRIEIERFIADQFAKHFSADIRQFMPALLGLHNSRGELRAAVGCRSAAAETLFLETYTQAPIEKIIASKLGVFVRRTQIVEIGSLACCSGLAAMVIVKRLVPYLIDSGYTWVVFTGADTVLKVFRRLNLLPQPLCKADKSLLGAQQYLWGTYYDHKPIVMAGRLLDAVDALDSLPTVQ